MSTIQQLIQELEQIAPPQYQEGYDNAGLITGQANWEISGVLCCLDATEAVLDEALAKGCNLIVAHHPIVFKGLKKLNGRNYVERVVIKAIKNDLAIYAIHTNLDHVYHQGVNTRIAQRLGLGHTRILVPKHESYRLVAYTAPETSDTIRMAIDQIVGAQATRFATVGAGYAQPGARVSLETIVAAHHIKAIRQALDHSPATVYSIHRTEEATDTIGAGMIGQLAKPMDPAKFLAMVKKQLNTACIRHTALPDKPISRVAVCGGAGSFLLPAAISQGADAFVTADYKYHEFFDADGHLLIADVGHYESEQFTSELLCEIIREKFVTFAAHCAETITNPVQYLC